MSKNRDRQSRQIEANEAIGKKMQEESYYLIFLKILE